MERTFSLYIGLKLLKQTLHVLLSVIFSYEFYCPFSASFATYVVVTICPKRSTIEGASQTAGHVYVLYCILAT
jgi:hypothetical protein